MSGSDKLQIIDIYISCCVVVNQRNLNCHKITNQNWQLTNVPYARETVNSRRESTNIS